MVVAKKTRKSVRRSVSLAAETDAQVQKLALYRRLSANRILEDLIETGLAAKEAEKRRFFELAERLRVASDVQEIQRLKDELARMTFGSWMPKIRRNNLPSDLRSHL